MQAVTVNQNHQVANSPKPFSISAIDKVWTRLNQLLAATYPPIFKAGTKPNEEQIAKTRLMIEEARALLSSRTTPADVAKIFTLLSGGMATRRDSEAAISAQTYTDALSRRSSWAVNKAYMQIIEGEAKEFSLKFMPQAPELSQFCKEIETSMEKKLDRIEAMLAAPEEISATQTITQERFEELQCEINKYSGEAA